MISSESHRDDAQVIPPQAEGRNPHQNPATAAAMPPMMSAIRNTRKSGIPVSGKNPVKMPRRRRLRT